jgi:hypothetical protein
MGLTLLCALPALAQTAPVSHWQAGAEGVNLFPVPAPVSSSASASPFAALSLATFAEPSHADRDALPDAPSPRTAVSAAMPEEISGIFSDEPIDSASARSSQPSFQSEVERNTACENGTLRGKPCRVTWLRVLGESVIFLAAQHGGNIAMDKDTRYNLTHGSFWGDYAYCVEHYRWWRWKDDDPFGVDYIGHPMMGAFTNAIYEQNDPKQRALVFENTHRYWFGRLKATAYSAAYSAQWKIGPASEASIGNTGIGYYVRARDGVYTNETGMQDFFITPVGGFAWNVGEDIIDRYIFRRILASRRNKLLLIAASVMTPTRSGANITRFRASYYRDYDAATDPNARR